MASRGGASPPENNIPREGPEEREGVVDMIGSKLKDAATSVAHVVEDTGLKIAGLERIQKTAAETETMNQLSNTASNLGTAVSNVSAGVLEKVNDVLGSKYAHETVQQAAQKTAAITGELAETVNKTMDNPVLKEKVHHALENLGEFSSMVVEAGKEPFNEAVEVAAESVSNASGAVASGAVRVGTDFMAAIPGVGAVIEMLRAANDGSKAFSSVVEAGSKMAEAVSDGLIRTKQNFDENYASMVEKRKMIAQRTADSINKFSQPLKTQMQGQFSQPLKTQMQGQFSQTQSSPFKWRRSGGGSATRKRRPRRSFKHRTNLKFVSS
jgi:hypothetical protein